MFADKLCALFQVIADHKAKSVNSKNLVLLVDILKQIRHVHTKYSQQSIISLDEKKDKLQSLIKKMPFYTVPFLNDLVDLVFAITELEMELNT